MPRAWAFLPTLRSVGFISLFPQRNLGGQRGAFCLGPQWTLLLQRPGKVSGHLSSSRFPGGCFPWGKTLVWGWSPRERQGAEPSGGWSPTPGRDGDRKEAGHRRGLQTCRMDDLERICLQRALQDLPWKRLGVQRSP